MMVRLYEKDPDPAIIRQVVDLLERGGVIIYPTDTVYGIGCDISKARAIERVARFKGVKPEKANFACICSDFGEISNYAKVDNNTFKLMKSYLPGPYTFILNSSNKLPNAFKNKKKTVGIRIPENAIILEIVRVLGRPILTTSLKEEDDILEYPTDPELIHETYGHLVDLVINGGFGGMVPSTILDCTGEEVILVRQGLGKVD
jgi:tRNA threonylcarbamoyl adenosine modification protein (Sua5/YciO/YrdC/YwlC family)